MGRVIKTFEELPLEVQNKLGPCKEELTAFFQKDRYIHESRKKTYHFCCGNVVDGSIDIMTSDIQKIKKYLENFLSKKGDSRKSNGAAKFQLKTLDIWPKRELKLATELAESSRFLSLSDFTPVERVNTVEETSEQLIRFSTADAFFFSVETFTEKEKTRILSSDLVAFRRNELIFDCIEKQGWKQKLKKSSMKSVGQPCDCDKENLSIPQIEYIEFSTSRENGVTKVYVKFILKSVCVLQRLLVSISDDSLIEEEIEDTNLDDSNGPLTFYQSSVYGVMPDSELEKAIRAVSKAPATVEDFVGLGFLNLKRINIVVARKYLDIYSNTEKPVEFTKKCIIKTVPCDGSSRIYMVHPKASETKSYFWAAKEGVLSRDFDFKNSIPDGDYPGYPQCEEEMLSMAENIAKAIQNVEFIQNFPINATVTVSFNRKKVHVLIKEMSSEKDCFTREITLQPEDNKLPRDVHAIEEAILEEIMEPLLLIIVKQYGTFSVNELFDLKVTPVEAAILKATPADTEKKQTRSEICKLAHDYLLERYPLSYVNSVFDKLDEKGVYSKGAKKTIMPFDAKCLRGAYGRFFVYSRINLFEDIDFAPCVYGDTAINEIPSMTSNAMVEEFEKQIKSVKEEDKIFALLSIMDNLPKMKLVTVLKSETGIEFLRKIKDPNDRKFAAIILESLPGCKKLIKNELGEEI